MARFHSLQVSEVRRETVDCVSVCFAVPAELAQQYTFIQGQHLTLRTFIAGEDVRRSYSICSSPFEQKLRVAVKKVEGGQFSTFANEELKKGDLLDVMTPMGSFHTPLDSTQRKHYAAFAAGSGITPILSILKTTLETEPQSHFTLFYSNRSTDAIIFLEEIEGLKNRYMQRLSVHYLLSREFLDFELFQGRITVEKCRQLCEKTLDVADVDEFFICGPENLIEEVKETLLDLGIDRKHIHFELFTSPKGKLGVTERKWTPPAVPVVAKVTVTLDGKTFEYDHISPIVTILDAAQKTGADLPFACKGGVCCTCKAKVLEGEVEMELNYGLDPEEVEKGYVLTCQAHPKTSRVVVSFDE